MKKIRFYFLLIFFSFSFSQLSAQTYDWEMFYNYYFIHEINFSPNGYMYVAIFPECIKGANSDIEFGRLFKTTNDGITWQTLIEVTPANSCAGVAAVETDANDNVYICFPYPDLRISSDFGNTWDTLANPSATYISDVIIAQNGNIITTCYDKGLYLSTNNGNSWELVINKSGNFSDKSLYVSPNGYIYALAYADGELYRSVDNGVTWTKLNLFIETIYLNMCSLDDGTIFLGLSNSDSPLMKSTDYGDTWVKATDFFDEYSFVGSLLTTKTNSILAVSGDLFDGKLFYSEDGGVSWKQVFGDDENNYGYEISCLAQNQAGSIYMGTDSGIFKIEESALPVEFGSFSAEANGSDVFLNWTTLTEINNKGFAVERAKEDSDWNEIGFVNGNGTTTEARNYSFKDENLNKGKYFYRLKQIDYDGSFKFSSTLEIQISPIEKFELFQNYPNPFGKISSSGSLSTTIKFNIKQKGKVALKVFNALGKEIAVLVNDTRAAGNYKVKFEAGNFPSGVYIYQIQTKAGFKTKKMILLR